MSRIGRATVTLAGLGVLCVLPRTAQASDAWWGPDKALHFGVSVALSGAGYAGSSLLLDEPWQRALAGGALSLGLGAAKEGYDAWGDGDPSWRDFAWDAAGSFVGASIALTIDVSCCR